jgi:hypothetical protein
MIQNTTTASRSRGQTRVRQHLTKWETSGSTNYPSVPNFDQIPDLVEPELPQLPNAHTLLPLTAHLSLRIQTI